MILVYRRTLYKENTAETFVKYRITASYRLINLVHTIFDAVCNNLDHVYRDSILLIHRKFLYIISEENDVMCNKITDQNKHISTICNLIGSCFPKNVKNNHFRHI